MDDASDSGAPTRNPFASPGFTRWWLASMLGGTGVGIQSVAVPLFIRDRVAIGDRALAIAAALVAQMLPGACLALVGGAVADRVENRRILVRTYLVAASVSVAYVGLSWFDVRSIAPVFVLAAIVGSAGAFTNPARQSMLPRLVTRAQLQNGVILGTMGFMATLQFLGPTLAGFVVELRGVGTAFAGEFLLLVAAAAVFARVPTVRPEPTGRSVIDDLRAGVRYVREERRLLGLVALATVPGIFFIGPFAVTIALVVPDLFHAPDRWVGILWGCFGGGVVTGSILLTLRPVPRRGLAVCIANLVGGFVLVAYGLSTSLPVAAVLLVIWGLGASIFMNYVVALLQQHAEPRMIGRVMSMYTLVFFVSMPIGYGQAGLLTDAFGPSVALVASGAVSAVIASLCLAFLPSVRNLD